MPLRSSVYTITRSLQTRSVNSLLQHTGKCHQAAIILLLGSIVMCWGFLCNVEAWSNVWNHAWPLRAAVLRSNGHARIKTKTVGEQRIHVGNYYYERFFSPRNSKHFHQRSEAVAVASFLLRLTECISEWVSEWVSQWVSGLGSRKFANKLFATFWIALKTHLSLFMSDQYYQVTMNDSWRWA